MYLPYFIVFIEVTRPWRHGLFPGTRSPGSSVYFPLKAMLWRSWSVWWTHLSLLSDDGWSLAKCISVFMVTGILTLMLHTAVMGSLPATTGEVHSSPWAEKMPPSHGSWEGQCMRGASPWSKCDKLAATALFFSSPLALALTEHTGC